MPTKILNRFAKNEDGAIAVIVSLLMVVLLGFVALGVDTASLYRERAQLQSVSDLTAMSAMAVPASATARATHALERNQTAPDALETLQTGRFLRNPAIAPQDRFTVLPAGSPGINAVRVVLQEESPLYFSRIFTDDDHITLDRKALATRTGATSFSLNSHLVDLGGVSLNEALAQRFGVNAALTLGDLEALARADIDMGALLDALEGRTGVTTRNPAEILNAVTTASDVIASLQSVLPDGLASGLTELASAAGSASFAVSSLVGGIDTELGLTAAEFSSEIELSALDVVKALVAAESADQGFVLDAPVAVPGVITATTSLTAGEPPARSGWIALGEEGVQLQRAAIRLRSDVQIEPDLLENLGVGVQIASLNLPIYTELAGSTATLDRMACNITSPQGIAAQFRTAHTALHPGNGTSVAALYLGSLSEGAIGTGPINPADLDFADLLTVSIVIDLPLLPDVTIPGVVIQARSHVTVGASQTETIGFTHDEVAEGMTSKSFGSGDLLSSAIGDLLSPAHTELRVKPGQDGLVSGLAAPVVAGLLTALPEQLLSSVASPVDGVLDATLASVGVQLGAGELTLTGHHCEPIQLVR